MKIFYSLILALAIVAGQLVKIPMGGNGGVTLLDTMVLILCLIGLYQIKLHLVKPQSVIKYGLLFSLVALVSLAFTPLKLTPQQYLTSFLYLIRFFSLILLGWLLVSRALPIIKQNINKTLLLSGAGLAILGLFQFIFFPDLRFLAGLGWDPHLFRTVSTFLDPNFAGAFFVLTLLLLSQNFSKSKKWIIYFALVYLALLTTFSRSSYGMFLISFLILAFLQKSVKLLAMTIILFAILVSSFQPYIKGVNKVTPLDRGQTASFRLSTWQQGLEIFQKNPVLGVGFNAYSFAIREYRLGDEQFLNSRGSTTNDSSLLHILSTTGIIGLLTYSLFILAAIRFKNHILTAGFIGLLAHSFFVNSLFYPFIFIWIILMAVSSYDKQHLK